jgi:hypothetical protein
VLARRYDIPVQVAVEEAMACGTGVCMTCVLPVSGSDGITRMTRTCVDGPVFRGEQVRWDDIGTIPFDAFGAPGWEPRPRRAAQAGRGAGQVLVGQPAGGVAGGDDGAASGPGGAGAGGPTDSAQAGGAQAGGAPDNGQPKARPARTPAARTPGGRGRSGRRQGHGS